MKGGVLIFDVWCHWCAHTGSTKRRRTRHEHNILPQTDLIDVVNRIAEAVYED